MAAIAGPEIFLRGMIQVQWLRESLGTLEGKKILEIGSGWEPLLPMLFSLCRTECVYLTDQTALLDRYTLAGGLETFRRNRQRILATLHLASEEFAPNPAWHRCCASIWSAAATMPVRYCARSSRPKPI
jgi:hypothetical protein